MAPWSRGARGTTGQGGRGSCPLPSPSAARGRLWSGAHTSEFIVPPGKGAGTSARSGSPESSQSTSGCLPDCPHRGGAKGRGLARSKAQAHGRSWTVLLTLTYPVSFYLPRTSRETRLASRADLASQTKGHQFGQSHTDSEQRANLQTPHPAGSLLRRGRCLQAPGRTRAAQRPGAPAGLDQSGCLQQRRTETPQLKRLSQGGLTLPRARQPETRPSGSVVALGPGPLPVSPTTSMHTARAPRGPRMAAADPVSASRPDEAQPKPSEPFLSALRLSPF